jgi:hypothetical protein
MREYEPFALIHVEIVDAGHFDVDEKLAGSWAERLCNALDGQLFRSTKLVGDDALHR